MLLTDNAVSSFEEDQFGFTPHARILCNAIESANPLPLTVGVFGSWGTGKTSFINICRSIMQQRGTATISFNPWKYDQRDQVWHALIQTVIVQLVAELKAEGHNEGRRAYVAQALETALRLSRTAAWLLARRLLSLGTGGLLTADEIDRLASSWDERDADEYMHVNQFEADFAEVVHTYTRGGRLVLFVDDLDRCTPEAAIAVLDALRLFLGESSCVFVLAMDHRIVSEAAAARFGGDWRRGHQYLEKLVQLPYHLPVVSYETIFTSVQDSLRQFPQDMTFWEIPRLAFGGNPRRVRRFVNVMNIAAETMELHSPLERDRFINLAQMLVVRTEHPDTFSMILREPSLWDRLLAAAQGDGPMETFDGEIVDQSLLEFLAQTSPKRTDFDFPEPPNTQQLQALTEVLSIVERVTGPASELDSHRESTE